MKVVINNCYGRFNLSYEAITLIADKIGNPLWFRDSPLWINRHEPALVEVVEELGEKANTLNSNLVIIEIPGDHVYKIQNWLGIERIVITYESPEEPKWKPSDFLQVQGTS